MKKNSILICGASGFIGRNLFEYFSKRKDLEVYGTYLDTTNQDQRLNSHLCRIDFRDPQQARFITKDFDVVINAAAMTDGSGAISSDPGKYITDNVLINTNLIEAVNSNRVPHFIFLSCTVMYPSSTRPLEEDEHDLDCIHPKYFMGARMKVFSEDLCRFYSELGQTCYTAIRHSNIYGPYDKFDLQRGHVFAATATKIMNSTNGKITVWGQGEEKRDLLHVYDLTRFINIAIERAQYKYEIFNVGLGGSISIRDLVQKMIAISGKKLSVEWDNSKPSINTSIILDIEKAERILGWQPTFSLDRGIQLTLDWYEKNMPPR